MKEEAVSAALTGNQMRLIIAGGRRYRFGPRDIQLLNSIRSQVRCVLSGHAPGADQGGEGWAWDNDLPIIPFPAEWDRYEDSAGPIRNGEMARKATAVALFPGGGGTADMFRQACVHRLRIFDWRNLQAGEVSLEHCQPYEPIDDDRPFKRFSCLLVRARFVATLRQPGLLC